MDHVSGMGVCARSATADTLRSIGWLSRTPADFQQAVLDNCRRRTLERNEVLYSVGEPIDGRGSGLWGVVSGGVAIEIAPAERGPTFAHFARRGFWFGASAVLTRQGRNVTAIATRPTTLVTLATWQFDRIAAEMPLAWRWVGQLAAEHLQLSFCALDDLMIRNPAARAIAVLLRLTGRRQGLPEGEAVSEVDVSQESLAAMANLSRSSIGSILRALERRGSIEVCYRRIRLVDPHTLEKYLDGDGAPALPDHLASTPDRAAMAAAMPEPDRPSVGGASQWRCETLLRQARSS